MSETVPHEGPYTAFFYRVNMRLIDGIRHDVTYARLLAGNTHPSDGSPAALQRTNRIPRTRFVIDNDRRAAFDLPCSLKILPLSSVNVTHSHFILKHSSGRSPVSTKTVAIDRSGSVHAANILLFICRLDVIAYLCTRQDRYLTFYKRRAEPFQV